MLPERFKERMKSILGDEYADFEAALAECKTVEEVEALITRFVSQIEAGEYRNIKQTAMNAFLDSESSNFPIATLYRLWSIKMGYLAG